MKKTLILIIILFSNVHAIYPHKEGKMHVKDMAEVFGIVVNDAKFKEWGKCITHNIDAYNENSFYTLLTQDIFPGFKCDHRLLFHWGYNSEPWSNDLEKKAKELYNNPNYNYSQQYEKYILFRDAFIEVLRKEQKRRNGEINKLTEETFGFAHGGIDAKYANRFASMAYNTHLLGDYMTDNQKLRGLPDINRLLRMLCQDIETLGKLGKTERDFKTAKAIVDKINQKSHEINDRNLQQTADEIMLLLKNNFPAFIRHLSNGSIMRRLENKGFQFVS